MWVNLIKFKTNEKLNALDVSFLNQKSMKKEENKIKSVKVVSQKREEYLAPHIEVVEIEIEQNLFAGSGDLPGLPGEDW